jgi:hypothetical protein
MIRRFTSKVTSKLKILSIVFKTYFIVSTLFIFKKLWFECGKQSFVSIIEKMNRPMNPNK